MYGRRRYSKGYSSRGTSSRTRFGTRRTYKKVGRRFVRKPRFALTGYVRNVEKKYFDKAFQGNSNETSAGNPTSVSKLSSGVVYQSTLWDDYQFSTIPVVNPVSNDLLKGVPTGTTAKTRVGNKVKVNYVKGAMTFTAAAVDCANAQEQGGEAVVSANSTNIQYLRTTYRMVIVKDLQVNSTDTVVMWGQVFEGLNGVGGVHSELNVSNMGRFIVLEDKYFTVDADSPQKTIPFQISGRAIGSVRYNADTATALTDKGLYIIFAAYVMGMDSTTATLADIRLPNPVGHSRMCFTDE